MKRKLYVSILIIFCVSGTLNLQSRNEFLGISPKERDNNNCRVAFADLIRRSIVWSESAKTIDLLPVVFDEKTGRILGFDSQVVVNNLQVISNTGYFTEAFIENYKQLIDSLDKKYINLEYGEWYLGELPPFKFANGLSPWCMCQGFDASLRDSIAVVRIDSLSAELKWIWNYD